MDMNQILNSSFDRDNPDNHAGNEKKEKLYTCVECHRVWNYDQLIKRVITFGRALVCPDCLGNVEVFKQ